MNLFVKDRVQARMESRAAALHAAYGGWECDLTLLTMYRLKSLYRTALTAKYAAGLAVKIFKELRAAEAVLRQKK